MESLEAKLRKASQDIHQVKVDKKILIDRLKVACDATKEAESSRKELKDSLEGKHKLKEQHQELLHRTEVVKLQHESALACVTSKVVKPNQEDKIKRLEEELQIFKGKAKQYDAIAATGVSRYFTCYSIWRITQHDIGFVFATRI